MISLSGMALIFVSLNHHTRYFAVGCDGLDIYLKASEASENFLVSCEAAVQKITSYEGRKDSPE